MKALRLAGAVILTGSLLLFAARATATASPSPAAPCTELALTSHLTNVASVQSYGCAGPWAYLWATLSVSSNQISVTELMSYASGTWRPVSRSTYCHPGELPDLVYHRACFSN